MPHLLVVSGIPGRRMGLGGRDIVGGHGEGEAVPLILVHAQSHVLNGKDIKRPHLLGVVETLWRILKNDVQQISCLIGSALYALSKASCRSPRFNDSAAPKRTKTVNQESALVKGTPAPVALVITRLKEIFGEGFFLGILWNPGILQFCCFFDDLLSSPSWRWVHLKNPSTILAKLHLREITHLFAILWTPWFVFWVLLPHRSLNTKQHEKRFEQCFDHSFFDSLKQLITFDNNCILICAQRFSDKTAMPKPTPVPRQWGKACLSPRWKATFTG